MKILHVSAECYPMAKVGGLADVVGALPAYQNKSGHQAMVVMPMHRTAYLLTHSWEVVDKGSIAWGEGPRLDYTIIKERFDELGFELYCVDIHGLLDRTAVYGYPDDQDRFLAFQCAVVHWISRLNIPLDIVHLHDHHAGLIPFFLKYAFDYRHLSNIKTLFTIHNAEYQGWMDWSKLVLFPKFDSWQKGLLEWDAQINSLAAALKCADKVTTVSRSYMQDLMDNKTNLSILFNQEKNKCSGIINGIDYNTWNPLVDSFIESHYSASTVESGKQKNKTYICNLFGFDASLPLFIFIGRLVHEKAADLLPAIIEKSFEKFSGAFNFLLLGNGDSEIEHQLLSLQTAYSTHYSIQIAYDERLSHQMYAGADFLIMPSRVEPCGLNQMYAMRYGTIPMVRKTGGLMDTVIDIDETKGSGITFFQATVEDVLQSMGRALDLYQNKNKLKSIRKRIMKINNSWQKSTTQYINLYQSIIE